jgi:hypothetical protein
MRRLIELREQCKSYLKDEDFIEALSLVLALAKSHPEIVSETAVRFNQDSAASGTHLLTALAKLQKREPNQPWQPGCLEQTPPLIIGLVALYVHRNIDWVDSATVLLTELYYSDICRHSTHTPALGDFLFEIIGPENQGTILDPFAGIGSLTNKITATRRVLNEQNHQLASICHRLAITQGRTDRVHSFHYLMASCTPKDERRQAFDREQRFLVNQKQIDLIVSDLTLVDSLYPQTSQYLEEHFTFLVSPDRKLPTTNRAHALLVIQQALSQLKDTGHALLVIPNSWLGLGGYNAKVRNYLLENNLISEVILLDEINRDYGTRYSILRIQPKAPEFSSNNVLFSNQTSARIDAEDRLARTKLMEENLNSIGPEPSPNYIRFFEESSSPIEPMTEETSTSDLMRSQTESKLLAQLYPFEFKGNIDKRPHQTRNMAIEAQQAFTRLSIAQKAAHSAQKQLAEILRKKGTK